VIHDAIYCGVSGYGFVVRRGICHGLLGDDHDGRDGADDIYEFERPQAHADEQFRESDVRFIQRSGGDDRGHELRGGILDPSTWVGHGGRRLFFQRCQRAHDKHGVDYIRRHWRSVFV